AYAHTVIQHLREPERALREIRRVLAPGALLARATPIGAFFSGGQAILLLSCPWTWCSRSGRTMVETRSTRGISATCCAKQASLGLTRAHRRGVPVHHIARV